MSRTILIIGESGRGKSTSLRNMDPSSTMIIKPNSKPLPFKGAKSNFNTENKNVARITTFKTLTNVLHRINSEKELQHIKTIVIEDISHYFNYRVMQDAKKTGFQKWTDLGVETYGAFLAGEQDELFREDLTIVLIGHVSESTDANGVKTSSLYTPGTLLERQVKIPSYVTYQFYADMEMKAGKPFYHFLTNADGTGKEAKTPMGLFEELKIDNDLNMVLEAINKYE